MSVESRSDEAADPAAQLDAIAQQIADTREQIKVSESSVATRVQATADLNFAVGILARVRSALRSNADKNQQRRANGYGKL